MSPKNGQKTGIKQLLLTLLMPTEPTEPITIKPAQSTN